MDGRKPMVPSTFTKMRQVYWEAKQSYNKSLGRLEDNCIVSSDAELDIRLELLQAADNHFNALMRVILEYRNALLDLVNTQDNFGMSLIEYGTKDSTAGGKIMCLSGKSLSRAAQKQSQLKTPLMQLFYEVETFQFKATADALQTVTKMEKARSSYRSGLMWLKKESADIDPDVTKKMRNFRRVQEHIKGLKVRFDGVKLECMQKIDLYLLSRSNLFSHALIPYTKMFKKVSKHATVLMQHSLETIPLCLSYKFVALKELNEYKKVFQTTLQQRSKSNQLRKEQCEVKKHNKTDSSLVLGDNALNSTLCSKHPEKGVNDPILEVNDSILEVEDSILAVSDSINQLLIDLNEDILHNKSPMGDTVKETSSESGTKYSDDLLCINLESYRSGIHKSSERGDALEETSSQSTAKCSDDLLSINFGNYRSSSSGLFSTQGIEKYFENPLRSCSHDDSASKGNDELQFWTLMKDLEKSSKPSSINAAGIEKSTAKVSNQSSDVLLQTKWSEILEQFDPFVDGESKSSEQTLDLC